MTKFLPTKTQTNAAASYCVNLVLHKISNPTNSKFQRLFLNIRDTHVEKLNQYYPKWVKILLDQLKEDLFNDTRKSPKLEINLLYVIASAKKAKIPDAIFLPVKDFTLSFGEDGYTVILNNKPKSIEDMRFAHYTSTIDQEIPRAKY